MLCKHTCTGVPEACSLVLLTLSCTPADATLHKLVNTHVIKMRVPIRGLLGALQCQPGMLRLGQVCCACFCMLCLHLLVGCSSTHDASRQADIATGCFERQTAALMHNPDQLATEARFAPYIRHDQYGHLGLVPQTPLEYLRLALLAVTVVPLKIAGALFCLTTFYLICRLSALLSRHQRSQLVPACGKVACRACLFCLGFVYIRWHRVRKFARAAHYIRKLFGGKWLGYSVLPQRQAAWTS